MTKSNCIYYDYGDTAPREYGAFCRITKEHLKEDSCINCDEFEEEIDLTNKKIIPRFQEIELIDDFSPKDLAKTVRGMAKDGWRLHGSIFKDETQFYYQWMVRDYFMDGQ